MTQGKRQRTEGKTSFLGIPFKNYTCVKCKSKFEDIGLNKGRQVCATCANPPTLEEYVENGMDYSKSFDECFRDQARLVREYNDKSKHS